MKLASVELRMMVWYSCGACDPVLCRVELIGKEFCSLRILCASAAQVLKLRKGVGETLCVSPASFERVTET